MTLAEQTKKLQEWIHHHPKPEQVKEKEATEVYGKLIDCIIDHNHLYYVENSPIISDKEYDDLFAYLKKIEETYPQIISWNSPTQSLIGQVSEWFNQAQHKVKLLSLENSYNAEDLKDFDERLRKILEKNNITSYGYEVEPKYDGLSAELIYEHWKFMQAITRGDGVTGDDITINAKTIKSIPKKLTADIKSLRLRGEIMMPKSVWKKLNKEREDEGLTPFANPRNAASWSVKLLDSGEVAKRGLVCFVYDVLTCEGSQCPHAHDNVFEWLGKVWLPILKRNPKCKNIDEVIKICTDPKTKEYLEGMDYDFDGIVIKVIGAENREILWATEHHPRRAIAYKFPAQLAATQINSVDFQVGRTGIITPVANLQPVELSGVTIKRVSLHNFDFTKDKDIHVHDRVWLQRSGEVIPYIVSTITDRRPKDAKKILPPTKCPSCGSKIIKEDIHYYCINPSCPAQLKEKLIHFTSKNCMDIEGIGESTVDLLVEKDMVKSMEDIYDLLDHKVQAQLLKFPGFGDKKVTEIVKQLEDSKKKPLWRLLNGLGIPWVGKKTAQEIVRYIDKENRKVHTLDDLITVMTDQEFLVSIYGIGEKIIEGIQEFFKRQRPLLHHLEKFWLNFDAKKYTEALLDEESSKWSFSITWTFPIKRETIVEIMQKNGYFFHEHPTKTTTFILIWEDAGSKKEKAIEYGIKLYENWSTIEKTFTFLKDIPQEKTKKIQTKSLF